MSPMDCSVDEALSNSTILREIFTLLNDEDLERCCHVSQFWRTVADPMVFSHFEIQLGKGGYCGSNSEVYGSDHRHNHGDDLWGSEHIVIREMARYNRKKVTKFDSNFFHLTKTLEQVLLAHKVSISLRFRSKSDEQKICMEKFLSKFGPLVLDLDFTEADPQPLNMFCKLLLNSLPNLRELNCTDLKFEDEDSPADQNFNPCLPQNKHKHLRKITFTKKASFTVQSFATILKMASNLNEIQHLPIELVNALELAQKGQVLKSLGTWDHRYMCSFIFSEYRENFLVHFQTLVRLQPKLSSFRLLKNPFPVKNGNFFDNIKPLILSVLESSSETLQTLYIPSTGLRGYESFPRMEAVQKLELGEMDRNYKGNIFPDNIFLTESFSNVGEIHISDYDLGEILNRLPENVISPWGSRIKILRVEFLCLDMLLMLQARFPSIVEFQFYNPSNKIAEVFPALAFWPCLKSLEIRMYCGDPDYVVPHKLDRTLTGLCKEVLDQLRDSSGRENFTDEEIQGFKDESPFSKFKELNFFKLIFTDADVVLGLSSLANEFGFKLFPHLKVTLEIPHFADDNDEEAVLRAHEPFDCSDNIEIIRN